MKNLFIVANWKSNFLAQTAGKWFEEESNIQIFLTQAFILRSDHPLPAENDQKKVEIIVCPPFTLLPGIKTLLQEKKLQFKLGAQNISPFAAGAYTGEINAQQVKEFADYVIIGHSERRTNFGETDSQLADKVKLALSAGLTPIFCVQNESTPVPEGVEIVAYEPPGAIGTGNPDTPENAEKVASLITNKYPFVKYVLYGGSVTSENIASFLKMEHIAGALIGGASLDPDKFAAILKLASS